MFVLRNIAAQSDFKVEALGQNRFQFQLGLRGTFAGPFRLAPAGAIVRIIFCPSVISKLIKFFRKAALSSSSTIVYTFHLLAPQK